MALMKWLWARMKANRQGMWMALSAMALVLGWRAIVVFHEPAHRRRIAAELGSIPQFTQNLYVNHAGNCVAYGQHTENNSGLYLCDTGTKKSRLLTEVHPQFCGWSPDDSRLAFVIPQPKDPGKSEIVICNGTTGEHISELAHPGFQDPKDFAWLSASALAFYVTSSVGIIEQRNDGTWFRAKTIPISVTNPTCFTACSSGLVAWKHDNTIEQMDLKTGTVQAIWSSNTNVLEDFVSSLAGPELLLKCVDAYGQYLLRYSPASGQTIAAGRIDPAHKAVFRPLSNWKDDSLTYISWDGARVHTVVLSDDGLNAFRIGDASAAVPEKTLDWCGGVMVHTSVAADHLFIVGHPTNEMNGVWDYNLRDGSLQCAVPNFVGRFKYAKYVTPSYGILTNSLGKTRGYSIWQPTHLTPGRKYPLVITQTVNGEWLPIEQTAANCGCFFAVVHRPYWLGRNLSEWSEDVCSLLEELRHDTNIDTNRVVLWGHSAEVSPEFQLLSDKPGLWAGAIFSAVGGLPDPRNIANKKVFLIAGEDSGDAKHLKDWQNRALMEGVPTKLFLQKHVGHNPTTLSGVRDRTEIFAQILSEDL